MTINFPKTLPYPTVQGYAIKPGEAIVRTEMEAGPARQRRRYTQTLSEDEMDVLTEIDLVTLELWTSKLHILVHSSLPYKLN